MDTDRRDDAAGRGAVRVEAARGPGEPGPGAVPPAGSAERAAGAGAAESAEAAGRGEAAEAVAAAGPAGAADVAEAKSDRSHVVL
ncbi:hypothetical protein GCM10009802_63860 [Streptomyces synnematoformans]|uniref:Uncharacterized protein n=1 Tax=Streptomyces synnematoformans TaxID=415721 RepID=A0ABN2A0E2_9ACTN